MVVVRQQAVTRDCWTETEALAAAREGFAARLSSARGTAEPESQTLIARAVEAQVIPRLLLAHRSLPPEPDASVAAAEEERVGALVSIVLRHELPAVESFVSDLLREGLQPDDLYLHLLAPAARRLGDMWYEDKCDITDVTVGLWRLQHVVRELGPSFFVGGDSPAHGPRAMIVALPGEQHTLGLVMVVDFFRRAGWSVWSDPVPTSADLVGVVRAHGFDIVGFSVASNHRLEQVVSAIRSVRRASRNRHVGIMVGGPLFIEHPELAASVGADATAVDGRQAVLQAQTLRALLGSQQ